MNNISVRWRWWRRWWMMMTMTMTIIGLMILQYYSEFIINSINTIIITNIAMSAIHTSSHLFIHSSHRRYDFIENQSLMMMMIYRCDGDVIKYKSHSQSWIIVYLPLLFDVFHFIVISMLLLHCFYIFTSLFYCIASLYFHFFTVYCRIYYQHWP